MAHRSDRPLPQARGALIVLASPGEPSRYEPRIVGTLRHYVRRGASLGLLHRIAGGAGHYNAMNRFWDLDGRTACAALAMIEEDSAGIPRRIDVRLSDEERRIALLQVIAEHVVTGRSIPVIAKLADELGVTERAVEDDIDWLRREGRVSAEPRRRPDGPRLHLVQSPSAVLA